MSLFDIFILISIMDTAQKMKFSIKDFFSKCDQIRRTLHFFCSGIWLNEMLYNSEYKYFKLGCLLISL